MPDAATWKRLSIYQLLTDRFARPSDALGNESHHAGSESNLRKYLGGTWRGIIEKLDYIQGMGFDAIWISPVVS